MSAIQPMFLITYIVAPLVFLLIFALAKPKWLPVSAVLSLVLNFLTMGSGLLYAETRVLTLCLILVQAAAVLVLSLAVQRLMQQFFHRG